jgi:truncated hemoglobin YjbI
VKPPSAVTLDNAFQQLEMGLTSSPISLRVPETLLVSEEGVAVLLYNDDRGYVQVSKGADLFQEFVSLCEKQFAVERERQEFPLYIFSSGHSHKALWTSVEAERAWTTALDHTKLLQRYVLPWMKEPSKILVVWRGNEIKRYRIKKRGIETVLQHLRARQRPSLKPSLREPMTPQVRHSVLEEGSRQIVSDYEYEELTTALVPAERFYLTLREVLGRFLREDEAVIELAYDVMQDSQDRLVFLNARWIETGQLQHPVRDLRAKFNSLMATRMPDAIPFVDLKEVRAQNVQMYLNRFSTVAADREHKSVPAEKEALEQTSSKLDQLMQNVTASKQRDAEQQHVKLESYHNDQLLECIVSRVYSKVLSEPLLQSFFTSMSKREFGMIKQGFVKAFTGVDNYYFKHTVKRVHEGLGIERRQFSRFVELFVQAMQEEGVRSSDVEIVSRHLNRFADEVIEDDGT